MGRYHVVGLPTDGTWACDVCGAIVGNRQLHDTYAHADWASGATEAPPAKVKPAEYDHPTLRREYDRNPSTPPQRTGD